MSWWLKVIQLQIDLQVFPERKQTKQSFAPGVTWKKYEIFQAKLWGSLVKGKPKIEKKKENRLVPASNTVTKITALSLMPVAQIKLRAKESSL